MEENEQEQTLKTSHADGGGARPSERHEGATMHARQSPNKLGDTIEAAIALFDVQNLNQTVGAEHYRHGRRGRPTWPAKTV
jgi:hypothetical protein